MANKETVGDFEVSIEEEVIKAVHWKHRHEFSARWHKEFPHLTNFDIRRNQRAGQSAEALEQEARGAMLSTLRKAGHTKE